MFVNFFTSDVDRGKSFNFLSFFEVTQSRLRHVAKVGRGWKFPSKVSRYWSVEVS